jgi:hypothetical protein
MKSNEIRAMPLDEKKLNLITSFLGDFDVRSIVKLMHFE